jgi:hypothetical protein
MRTPKTVKKFTQNFRWKEAGWDELLNSLEEEQEQEEEVIEE